MSGWSPCPHAHPLIVPRRWRISSPGRGARFSLVPELVRVACYNKWQPAYAATDLWATRPRPSAADGVAQ